MTNQADDDIPVLDLSTEEDREAVLAEALAHAEIREAQYRQPLPETRRPGAWKAPLALVLLLLSAYLVAAPPRWLAGPPPPALGEADMAEGIGAALALQAAQVEVFRLEHGRLPGSQEELTPGVPGVTLVPSGARQYQLFTFDRDGNRVVFDPARPGRSARVWTARLKGADGGGDQP